MNLCKNCQYFRPSNYCVSPTNGVSPIDGNPKPMFASTNRGENVIYISSSDKTNYCGPEGKHYVEIVEEPKRGLWKRIKDML